MFRTYVLFFKKKHVLILKKAKNCSKDAIVTSNPINTFFSVFEIVPPKFDFVKNKQNLEHLKV